MVSEQQGDTISLREVGAMVRRHTGTALILMIVFAIGGYMLSKHLPHRYKSKAVLTIQSGYFRHPLVSDLVSEVQEPSEMSSQRLALLRLALNDAFLDSLADRYALYQYQDQPELRALDRELLLKKIDYFSVSPTSFQVAIWTDSPMSSFNATHDLLTQMRYTLTQQRLTTLETARNSILKQAKLLKSTLGDTPSSQQAALEQKLATMEANLAALRSRFTESHPDVVIARGQTEQLRSEINSRRSDVTKAAQSTDDYTSVFLSPASRASTQEIFDDLLKKLSHLNIVLEMERDRDNVSYLAVIEQPAVATKPTFPNPIHFMLLGAVAGLLVALIRAAYLEVKRAGYISPEQRVLAAGLELLGELPPLLEPQRALLLDHNKGPALALPATTQG